MPSLFLKFEVVLLEIEIKKSSISVIPCTESKSTCAAKEDALRLHTASVLPPMYWESHLYLVCSLHSSYSRLLLINAKSKPCNETPGFVTHTCLSLWQSFLTTDYQTQLKGGIYISSHCFCGHRHITLTPASKVLLSPLSPTSIKGNHIGIIMESTSSAQFTFFPGWKV